ncbi:hypothetical protein [Blastomonas aquatica]|uniref:hypothetical protein n=1 Tax=Blastomonas aquatica TaxID=1510276 RepID=UPI001669FE92
MNIRMRDGFIPLRNLGESLSKAGIDQDQSDAFVLDALRRGALLATGCREYRFDDLRMSVPIGERESIRRSWWRGFRSFAYREAGAFSARNNVAGYYLDVASQELIEAMAEANLSDRINCPIAGAQFRRHWTAYHGVRVEALAADGLIQAIAPSIMPASTRGKRGPPDKVTVTGLVAYIDAVVAEISICGKVTMACQHIAERAINQGAVEIEGRPAMPTSDDLEQVKQHLRSKYRSLQRARDRISPPQS